MEQYTLKVAAPSVSHKVFYSPGRLVGEEFDENVTHRGVDDGITSDASWRFPRTRTSRLRNVLLLACRSLVEDVSLSPGKIR